MTLQISKTAKLNSKLRKLVSSQVPKPSRKRRRRRRFSALGVAYS